jgi:hypothetical protein
LLFLVVKSSHVGDDVDGLACSLHHPTICDHQTRGQSFLLGGASSHHAAVGCGTFPGGVKLPGLDM